MSLSFITGHLNLNYAHFVDSLSKLKFPFPKRKLHYLFGGNVGEIYTDRNASTGLSTPLAATHVRLNDLWKLELIRLSKEGLLNKMKFLIRRQMYLEMMLESFLL